MPSSLDLSVLVALCVKNNKTPDKVGFADFVVKACASMYGMDRKATKHPISVLISAWYFDRWKSWIKQNPSLKKEEIGQWIEQHSQN